MDSRRCPFRNVSHSQNQVRATAHCRVVVGAIRLPIVLAAIALAPAFIAGCETTQKTGDSAANNDRVATTANDRRSGDPALAATRDDDRRIRHEAIDEIEQRYVIGPMTTREFGFRIDWQYPDAGENLKTLKVRDDAVFALDRRNFLTRINRDNGVRLWRLPVAEPIMEIFGLTYIEELDRVYVTTGGAVLDLDASSGSQVGRQTLEKIANTAPTVYGSHLIYGARNGQLIWHSYTVAYQWRAYQISRSIRIAPVIDQNVVVTIGVDGRVAALDVRNARMLWSQRLLGRVEARPAVGDGGVFVAGTDQHLWAFDLRSGRTLWRYLSESPLTLPPTLIGEHVYQYIPDQGFVCFEAFPLDQPGGRIIWENPAVRGVAVGKRGNRLFVWDKTDRKLSVVDARRGGTIRTIHLPQVHALTVPTLEAEEIFAASDDGRVLRLLPRN